MMRHSIRLGALVVLALQLGNAESHGTSVSRIGAVDIGAHYTFGESVSITSGAALVGAPGGLPWNPGAVTGAVHVFQQSGDGSWNDSGELIPQESSVGDWFGSSIDIDGDMALIGARYDSQYATESGSAYLFRRDVASGWRQVAKLKPNASLQHASFGASVSLYGDTALIGAPDANSGEGVTYVFKDDGSGNWSQIAELRGSDVDGNDLFGESVSLFGNRALIGAPQWDRSSSAINYGRAYIFEPDANNVWRQVQILNFSGYNYAFGTSVALGDDVGVIGGPNAGGGNCSECGTAQLIVRNSNGQWVMAGRLAEGDRSEQWSGGNFGTSVAIDGGTIVVGRPESYFKGAYVFEETLGSYALTETLNPEYIVNSGKFGKSISVSGKSVLVGDSGAVYFYDLAANVPEPHTMLIGLFLAAAAPIQRHRRRASE